MELKSFAQSLTEDKEEKVIEATKISINELMPKLDSYKKTLKEGDETQQIAAVNKTLQSYDPKASLTVKNGKYIFFYKGQFTAFGDLGNALKQCVTLTTSK